MRSAALGGATAVLRAEKDALRRSMRTTLRGLPAEQLAQESARAAQARLRLRVARLTGFARPSLARAVPGLAIEQRLLASDVFKRSTRVGVYVSCERLREVDTHGVLRELFRSGWLL
jgi:hypothetical protein